MSARCTSAVFERYQAVQGEYLLALALADNAHDDGTHIFPSVDTMAHKSRQSVRAVQRHLKAMLDKGWLLRVKAGGGRGVAAEYRINPMWLNGANLAPFSDETTGPEKGANLAPFPNGKGCHPRQERVPNEAQKGAKRSTPYITRLTVIEPSPLPPEGGAPGFDQFLAGYPRPVDVVKARKAWDALAPDAALLLRIVRAVEVQARSAEWQRENGRFIPKPANWLRNQRWLDVPEPASKPAAVVLASAPPAPELTPEQRARNRERAAAAAELARNNLRESRGKRGGAA